jgi:hypothetical protein
MKSPGWMVAALAILGSFGCDGYEVTYTVPFDRVFPFEIDTQSSLSTTASLTRAQILGSLDLPSSADVRMVALEGVTLRMDAAAGNTATQAGFTMQYDELPDAPGPANLSGTITVPVGPGLSQSLDTLVPAVVARFTQNLTNMLMGRSPNSISVTVQTVSRTPATARLHITGSLTMLGSMTVSVCEKVPAFGISSGEQNCIR